MPGRHAEDSVPDCVEDVMNQGHDEDSAYAICEASINDKSFHDTELASMLKESGADDWVDTVGRLVRSDVESSVIADVVKRARSGETRQAAQKAMAKSDKIEKVGFTAEVGSQFTIFKAGEDDFVIWGPASVEIVDKEGDKIQAKALQKALPQLLKRARLSLEHSDQLVGRILERFETDSPVEVEVADTTFKRSDFPTDVLELDAMEPALYVAGEIWDDSRQSQKARERIQKGELNGYSISGEALVTRKKVTSEGDTYDDVVDIDLSAVTLCEEGMNQKAQFAQIDESGKKEAAEVAKNAPDVSTVASLAKNAISETMSETNKGSNEPEGFDPEQLTAEFKGVLDDKLPDGELATKDDTLTRDEVESIAREVVKEDVAGEEDDEDEGYSEAEGRPGEEADVEGEEAGPPGAQKDEDVAGEETDEDEGYSEAEGRPGEEADVEGDEGGPPGAQKEASVVADLFSVDMDKAEEILATFKDEYEEGDYEEEPPEPEDEPPEPEDEPPHEPGVDDDDDVHPEDKGGGHDYAERDPDMEDEEYEDDYEEDEMGGDYEDEPDTKEGYAMEELEEKLPGDVWEVVREYLDEGEGEAPAPEGEPDAEGEEVMASQKSDDVTKAVEKILSDSGLEKAEGVGASAGSEATEKSYDDEPENEPGHGNNPALSNFYGE